MVHAVSEVVCALFWQLRQGVFENMFACASRPRAHKILQGTPKNGTPVAQGPSYVFPQFLQACVQRHSRYLCACIDKGCVPTVRAHLVACKAIIGSMFQNRMCIGCHTWHDGSITALPDPRNSDWLSSQWTVRHAAVKAEPAPVSAASHSCNMAWVARTAQPLLAPAASTILSRPGPVRRRQRV